MRVAVFGLGRFGASVAATLHEEGVEVLAVDQDRRLVDRIKDYAAVAVSFDATDRDNLERFEIGHMDAVVVGIGDNFEASVMVTLLCKELGVPHIICKAVTQDQLKVLQKIGADRVIQPEHQMGRWLAEDLLHDSIVNMVELPDGYSLARIQVREDWCDRTLAELQLLGDTRLNLIQVHRRSGDEGEEMTRIPLPKGDFRLHAGDLLDVIGESDVIATYDIVGR